MEKESLGLVETLGYIPAIEAADAGAKAANVTLLGYEEVRAGLITVKFAGDVAAVTAAVTAGAAAARKLGKVVSVHVIARPDRQLRIIPGGPPTPSPPGEESAQQALEVPGPVEEAQPEPPSVPSVPEEELPPELPTTPINEKARSRKKRSIKP